MTQRILVVTPFYLPAWRGGGPIRSLAAMVEQHGDRHDFCVLTSAFDWGEATPLPLSEDARRGDWVPVGRALVQYVPIRGASELRDRRARNAFSAAWRSAAGSRGPDITYLNGVFPPLWTIAPLTLRRLGRLRLGQVVIAPRGEFSPGALEIKWRKKQAFLAQARMLGLFRGVVWHASTDLEAAEIHAILPDARVVVRENETELPPRAWRSAEAGTHTDRTPNAEPATQELSAPRALRVLYLGRLSPKKGVDVLLSALRDVNAPVEVTIAGSAAEADHLAHLRELGEAAKRAGHAVSFVGPVEHDRVDEMFRTHDVFVFPTAGENFGHSIAESLANGCPVMVTARATPWTEAAHTGGGRTVGSRAPADWARAIDDFAADGPQAWARSREAAADTYDAWRSSRPTESVFDLIDLPQR